MRRGCAWILALLLVLTLLTGCGGSGGDNAASEAAAGETVESTASDAAGGSWGAWPEESPAAPAEEGATGGEDRLADAKMIYTGHMEVETTAFEDAVSGLERLVEEMGGYFERAAVHDYGGYRSADYTARVPAERFQDLLAQVGELCHVTYQEQDSDNVSEAYYDTESRLVTQQTKLERLQTLLAQAETMEDIITIESAISETELAIEQLTGTLRHYDALVDFATVTISLQEVYQLSNVEEPATTFGERIAAAFASGWHGFVSALESFAVALAYGWVWVLLLAVIAAAVLRLLWRSRHPKGKPQDPPRPPEKPGDKDL